MYISTYVYIYIYLCTFIHICMNLYVHIYDTHVDTCICIYLSGCIHLKWPFGVSSNESMQELFVFDAHDTALQCVAGVLQCVAGVLQCVVAYVAA